MSTVKMSTVKPQPIALLTSDWHLSEKIWKNRSILDDAIFGLQQIIEMSNLLDVPIIAAGDLFDTKNPSTFILSQTKAALCARHTGRQNDVYYIQGQHERSTVPWLNIIAGPSQHVFHIHTEEPCVFLDAEAGSGHSRSIRPLLTKHDYVEEQVLPASRNIEPKWFVLGIDWTREDMLQTELDKAEEILSKIPDDIPKILVMHQVCACFMPKERAELTDGMLPDNIDLLVLGDYHVAATGSIETQDGRAVPIISPGGTHLRRISEDPIKKIFILYNDGSVTAVPLKTRRLITVEINDASEEEIREVIVRKVREHDKAPCTHLPENIQTPLLSVTYAIDKNPNIKQIINLAVENKFHIFYKGKFDSISLGQTDDLTEHLDTTFSQPTERALNVFKQMEQDEYIRSLVHILLQSGNVEDAYNQLKIQFINNLKNNAEITQDNAQKLLPTC
jgi:DNA repair exonuclease SbcCD nuclease subunit